MDKLVEGWLVVDYRTGNMRIMKRLGKMKPTELPIKMKLNIVVPDQPQVQATATITLGKKEVTEMMFEEKKDDDK